MGTLLALQKAAYEKALKKDWKGMVEVYETAGLAVLRPISVNEDCALHVAVQSKSEYPVIKLLEIAKDGDPNFGDAESSFPHPVLQGNVYGNTALHLAATVGNYKAVVHLVLQFPDLVDRTNKYEETPLFTAASFGETKTVRFLAKFEGHIDGSKLPEKHRVRDDGTSILHIAVQGEHFDTALLLLELDESLAELKDKNDKTAFHLLASMPSAFESGYSMGIFKKAFYSCLPLENYTPASIANQRDYNRSEAFKGWPIVKKVWDDKRKHALALVLAKKLIKRDGPSLESVKISKSSTGTMTTLVFGSIDTGKKTEQVNIIRNAPDGGKGECSGTNVSDKEGSKSSTKVMPTSSHDSTSILELVVQGDISTNVSEKEGSKSSTGVMPTPSHDYTGTRKIVEQGNISTNVSEKGGSNSDEKYIPIPLFIATKSGITEIVGAILDENPQAVDLIDDNGRNILHVAVIHRREKIFNLVKEKSMEIARLNLGVDNNGYTLLHHAADTKHYIKGSKPGPALQLQEELQWFERVQEIVPSHFALHRANNPMSTAQELFKEKHTEQLRHAQTWVKDTSQSCSTVAVLVATVVFAAAYTVPGGYEENKGTPVFLHSPYFLFFTIMDVISLAASLTSVVMFLSVLTSPFEIEDFRHSLPRKLMIGFAFLFFAVVTTMLTFGATILLTVHSEQKLTTSLITIAAFFPVLVFALMQFRLYIAFTGILIEFVNDIVEALPSSPLRSLYKYCKDKFD